MGNNIKHFCAVFSIGFNYLLRNPVNMIVYTAFPIVIILILGNALSSYISPDLDFEPVPVAFITDNPESGFAVFVNSEDMERFITVTVTDEAHAHESISKNLINAILIEKNNEITVIKATDNRGYSAVILPLVDSYKQISSASELAIINGAAPIDIFRAAHLDMGVQEMPLGKRVPSATDYYAVTMIVYILLYAGQNGLELFNKSLFSETGARIRTAPVTKPILIGGLISASTVVTFLQGMVTFIFTAAFYGVYWGERIPLVLLTLFILVLFSHAFALLVLVVLKNPGAAGGIIMAVFWVTTFVSGGFTKISFGELDKIFAYAPNSLVHTIIFGAIYGGNESKMMFSLFLICISALVMFIGAYLFGRRKLV